MCRQINFDADAFDNSAVVSYRWRYCKAKIAIVLIFGSNLSSKRGLIEHLCIFERVKRVHSYTVLLFASGTDIARWWHEAAPLLKC